MATIYPAQPQIAPGPLSLGELIKLIDSVYLGEGMSPGLVYGLLDYNFMIGSGNREDTSFITVGSEIYPGLHEHYEQRIEEWVMADERPGEPGPGN